MNNGFMGGPMHPAAVHVLASRKRKFLDQVKWILISNKNFLKFHENISIASSLD